jgi:hypothetical protein
MLVPMYVKILIIGLNFMAFASLFLSSDPLTRGGRTVRYLSMCMLFLDILVALRHMGVLDFH